MITQGLILMLVGMGVVFSFLAIMVMLMKTSSLVVRKLEMLFPSLVPGEVSVNDDLTEIAVALAAIKNRN